MCVKIVTTRMAEEDKKTTPVNPLSAEYRAIEQQYRRDVTMVESRPFLEHAAFFLWLLIDAALLAFFVYTVLLYIVSDSFSDARSLATLVANVPVLHEIVVESSPADLLLSPAKVITSSASGADLGADIENPNADWYATFTYSFKYSTGESTAALGFINPLEKRTLLALAVASTGTVPSAELSVTDLVWHRVDRHAVADVASWLAERNSFSTSGITYSNDIDPTAATLGLTDFTLTNATAYSYWEPKFIVFLEHSGVRAAVTEITVPRFLSGEARQIHVRWVDKIPVSATLVVTPEINYFDETIYMRPQP